MAESEGAWRPTTVLRVLQAYETAARTLLVETDAGKGYLKAMGGPEGEHTLACEWTATNLARAFGLPTFEVAIVEVDDDDELPFARSGRAAAGPAFITKAVEGWTWGGE